MKRFLRWLGHLFSNDRGWMTRGGKSLMWERASFPLLFVLTPEAWAWRDYLQTAADGLNSAVGRRVFMTVAEAARETLFAFAAPSLRPRLHAIVLGRLEPTFTGDGECLATADIEYDARTGWLHSVMLLLPPLESVASELRDVVALHELGHALGLDHDQHPDSVMWPQAREGQRLFQADIDRLRKAYG